LSIFPSKLRPGARLTIHLRVTTQLAAWIDQQVFVVDPDGEETRCYERLMPFLPARFSERESATLRESSKGIFQVNPLLMAARYLAPEQENVGALMETLTALRDATHLYTTFALPAAAKLGRYRVHLELTRDGHVSTSATAVTDEFFVEELVICEVVTSGGRREVTIENASPEAVLTRVCEASLVDGAPLVTTRLLELPPRTKSTIALASLSALLTYCGGSEVLRLGPPDDPFCVRNPRARVLDQSDRMFVTVPSNADPVVYQLDEDCAAIWRLATGFLTRATIRSQTNAVAYDDLIAAHLIREIE
jgi:hypothetical protein